MTGTQRPTLEDGNFAAAGHHRAPKAARDAQELWFWLCGALAAWLATALLVAAFRSRGEIRAFLLGYLRASADESIRAALVLFCGIAILRILRRIASASTSAAASAPDARRGTRALLACLAVLFADALKSWWHELTVIWPRSLLHPRELNAAPGRLVRVRTAVREDCALVLVPGTWNGRRSIERLVDAALRSIEDPHAVGVYVWEWLGRNSESARRLSAQGLACALKNELASARQVLIVGHSHGGSVAIAAARGVRKASVVCIGTPFVDVRPARFVPEGQRSFFWAAFLVCFLPVAGVFLYLLGSLLYQAGILKGTVSALYATFGWALVPGFDIIPLAAISLALPAVFLLLDSRYRSRAARYQALDGGLAVPVCVVRVQGDAVFEANAAAKIAQRRASGWFDRNVRELRELRSSALDDLRWVLALPALFVLSLVLVEITASSSSSAASFLGAVQGYSQAWFGSQFFLSAFAPIAAGLLLLHGGSSLAVSAVDVLVGTVEALGYSVSAMAMARLAGLRTGFLPWSTVTIQRVPRHWGAELRVRRLPRPPRLGAIGNPHSDVLGSGALVSVLREEIAFASARPA